MFARPPTPQSLGPGPVLLQVQCGTCTKLINVHANHTENLLKSKWYSCPNCKSRQTIEVDANQEQILLAQVRDHKASQAAAVATLPPNIQMNPHLVALINRAHNVAAARGGGGSGSGGAGFPGHPPPFPHQNYHQYPQSGGPRGPPGPYPHPGHLYPGQLQQLQQLQQQQQLGMEQQQFLPGGVDLVFEEEDDVEEGEVRDTFQVYSPSKLTYGQAHPDDVVETSSLSAVEPPDITYELAAKDILVGENRLSALQLEAVVYACQRHEQWLPSGARGGFFIGDGAGVGKGRTIAGLVVENWARGRRRHLWISIGSDLKFDSQRDLDDAGAVGIPLHALNKLPYGKLAGRKIGVTEGVIFLTYSSLVSSSDRGKSRFKQLVEWCGADFDGLIVFDESHKAKNLVPEAGGRSTQVGLKVQDIQKDLPSARIVYCSATGASEPRNMGYMVRLGLWGEGHHGFHDFSRFLEAVGKGGSNMAALELVAMDMKAQGMYVSRTLSFHGAEFETVDAVLEEPVASQYAESAVIWNMLYREFLAAEEAAQVAAHEAADAVAQDEERKNANAAANGGDTNTNNANSVSGGEQQRKSSRGSTFSSTSSMIWRSFWAAHQRFFRHMCMAAKVPGAVRMSADALQTGRCVVIGLQSTGEARTADVVGRLGEGEELDDFVSGPKELLLRLVDSSYPMPANPFTDSDEADSDESDSEEEFENGRVSEAAAAGAVGQRERKGRQTKVAVRYKEFDSDEDIGDSSSEEESASESEEEEEEESGDGGKSKSASASDPKKVNNADSDDDDDDGTAADSDGGNNSDFDPTASSERVRRRKADVTSSLDSRQRAEKEAEEEKVRAQQQRALEAYAAAVQKRDEIKAQISKLELPPNPLDDLIDKLGGPSAVAEMTGRKGRLVRDPVSGGVRYEPRNASGVGTGATLEMINVHERGLFLDGTKLISIISEAASAGISLHADRRVKNQRRRVHLTLELPWSADKAIQQFGRSHRANQASGPQYRLIFTPLGGERRFAAAVARRLESLGALTQGDRRAGPSLAAFNYDSTWGQRALKEMYGAILEDKPAGVVPSPCRPGPLGEPPAQALPQFLGKLRAQLINCGIFRHNRNVVASLHLNEFLTLPDGAPKGIASLDERDRGDVPRFLNRLLGLDPRAQAETFEFYQATLDDLTERARRDGSFDEGIVDLKAHSITLDGPPQVLHKDPITGASTLLQAIKLDRGMPWESAVSTLEAHEAEVKVLEAVDTVLSPSMKSVRPTDTGAAAVAAVNENGNVRKMMKIDGEDGVNCTAATDKEMDVETENGGSGAVGVKRSRDDEGGNDGADDDGEEEDAAINQSAKKAKLEGTNGDAIIKVETSAPALAKKESDEESEEAAEGVVDLTKDSDNDEVERDVVVIKPQQNTNPKSVNLWGSGFYKGRHERVRGRTHVLLALKVTGSQPPLFTIYRPTTGRNRKPFTLREMKEKYVAVEADVCKPLWELQYKEAGEEKEEGRTAMRNRTVHILCGAVMRSWATVQKAMVRHVKKGDRRMRVMRIATTAAATPTVLLKEGDGGDGGSAADKGEDKKSDSAGEDDVEKAEKKKDDEVVVETVVEESQSQRLVGMFIPESAVSYVVAELTKDDEREKEEAAAAKAAAAAAALRAAAAAEKEKEIEKNKSASEAEDNDGDEEEEEEVVDLVAEGESS